MPNLITGAKCAVSFQLFGLSFVCVWSKQNYPWYKKRKQSLKTVGLLPAQHWLRWQRTTDFTLTFLDQDASLTSACLCLFSPVHLGVHTLFQYLSFREVLDHQERLEGLGTGHGSYRPKGYKSAPGNPKPTGYATCHLPGSAYCAAYKITERLQTPNPNTGYIKFPLARQM